MTPTIAIGTFLMLLLMLGALVVWEFHRWKHASSLDRAVRRIVACPR